MKFVRLCLTLACLSCFGSALAQTEQSLDHIVAVVNDDVITQTELNHNLVMARAQIAQEGQPVPPAAALRKQALDMLINKKLQLQMAKQAGIVVTDAMLDKMILSIAEQHQMTTKELYERVNHDGMTTAEYRQEMRTQLITQRLQQEDVINRITISPDEVTAYLQSKAWRSRDKNEYHLEDLLIPVADGASAAEVTAATQRAQEVVEELSQGKNFQAVVEASAATPVPLQNGDLGWRKLSELPAAFSLPVSHLSANQLTSPIRTANGIHIIRVAEMRPLNSSQTAPTQKEVENILMRTKFDRAVTAWLSKLRGQAFIVVT